MVVALVVPVLVLGMIVSVSKASRAAGATLLEIGPPAGKFFVWGFGLLALVAGYLSFTDPTMPMAPPVKVALTVFGVACLCLRRTAAAAENGLFLVMGFVPWQSITAFEWKDDKTLLVTAAGKQRRIVVRPGVRGALDTLLLKRTPLAQPPSVAAAPSKAVEHPTAPVIPATSDQRADTPRKESHSVGAPDTVALEEANQFLRYRAESRAKVDAQAALMNAVLARPDAPRLRAFLFRSSDVNHEFPWLVVKSGTPATIAAMRNYGGYSVAFAGLFGDQPLSITWADHIAENCPGPGESVTALGRERYAQVLQEIRGGKYVLERQIGGSRDQ